MSATEEKTAQPSTPRTVDKAATTPRTAEAARKKKITHASTLATAGSNTLYANQAPFGTSQSRFSPSMTPAKKERRSLKRTTRRTDLKVTAHQQRHRVPTRLRIYLPRLLC